MYNVFIPELNKGNLKELNLDYKSDISSMLGITRHTLDNWLRNKAALAFSKIEKLNSIFRYTLSSIIISDEVGNRQVVRYKGQRKWRYTFRYFLNHVLERLDCGNREELNVKLKAYGISISKRLYGYLNDADNHIEEIKNLMSIFLFVDLCNICQLYPGEYLSDGLGEISPEKCHLHPNLARAFSEHEDRMAYMAMELDENREKSESLETDKSILLSENSAKLRELEINQNNINRLISVINKKNKVVAEFIFNYQNKLDKAFENHEITGQAYESLKWEIRAFENKYRIIHQ